MPDLKRKIPTALEAHARWTRFGDIPVMLVHPDRDFAPPASPAPPAPVVIWLHGRTVNKELDPGRYLRWLRAGFGACAFDLPGHGERYEETLQSPAAAWDVMTQAIEEVDSVVQHLTESGLFDTGHMGIGGMSLGGMATLARLTRDHPFICASVEATTGSWTEQRGRAMFENCNSEDICALEPILNLDRWKQLPIQAIHTRADQWVQFAGQERFVTTLRERYEDPEIIEFIVYDETGAPFEHAGFGKYASNAKNRQTAFFKKYLIAKP